MNLIGEHTDYNDGFVLPFAIDARTRVAASRRSDDIVSVTSAISAKTVAISISELAELQAPWPSDDRLPEWSRYPLGVAWALLTDHSVDSASGVDLSFVSDVAVGAGLSSSAAIESATARSLTELWGLDVSELDLARLGQRAENDAVGAPTGIMDQVASVSGRAGSAVFLDCRTLEWSRLDLQLDRDGLAVLVLDSGVRHSHATGGYGERRRDCEAVARALGVPALRDLTPSDLDAARPQLDDVAYRRARHVVTENERVIAAVDTINTTGVRDIGDLLVSSHGSMRDDFENSVPAIDAIVDACLDAGAIGARMTGGGFGGAVLAVVPAQSTEAIVRSVSDGVLQRGYSLGSARVVRPSDGARRES